MYTGSHGTNKTYHPKGNLKDPDGKRYFLESWDTRELEPEKEKLHGELKVYISELFHKYAPLHKQLNLLHGLITDKLEAKGITQNIIDIQAEYGSRKQSLYQAKTCDEAHITVHESYQKLIEGLYNDDE